MIVKLVEDLFRLVIKNKESLEVKEFPTNDDEKLIQVMIDEEDYDYLEENKIIIKSIQNIAYNFTRQKEEKKLRVEVDKF